eukprot:TRINITY_DN3214_c0_g1_i2.p1 TRINITY_DN3214_c0_g1~~TRINITY_DN3214_c0_g1_i2.p1  ORF type:complete len:671 (+),score=171.15 TRINITY_DN3214_c0_g1_i2:298-2310(+)
MEEDKRVKEVIRACEMEEQSNDLSEWEWDEELVQSELRRLEKYMRSHWATVLHTLKQISTERNRSKRKSKKALISALKNTLKEKILYEVTSMSLARIKRSSTPTDTKDKPVSTSKSLIKNAHHPKRGSSSEAKKDAISISFVADSVKLRTLQASMYEAKKRKWKAANNIAPNAKLFSVTGKYADIKEALESRGWLENAEPDSEFFDFKWTLRHRDLEYSKLQKTQMVNHFQRNGELSTKVGLLHNLKNLVWFDGTEVDALYPNAYDLADVEVPDFVEEFKLTKAESVLKHCAAKEGKLSELEMAKLIISINIGERRLTKLEELLEEVAIGNSLIAEEEWELISCKDQIGTLLDKYPHLKNRIKALLSHYRREYVDEHKGKEEKNGEKLIVRRCKQILDKLQKKYKQSTLNGTRNLWIAKPAGLSRGRGIHIFATLEELQDLIEGRNYVAQKYIENPLLILNRKFDIRQWILITSWNPLTVWVYKDFYIRFGAEDFDISKTSNKLMHLTNNSITKCAGDGKIEGNMWNKEQFLSYLKEKFEGNVWTKLKKRIYGIIVKSVKATQDVVVQREQCFEVFGYDIMIDETLNPWLIEVNCSPAVDYSTEVTKRLVKLGLEDTIKVVVDYGMKSLEERPKVSTGNYVKIYEGPKHFPQFNLSLSFMNKKILNVKCS